MLRPSLLLPPSLCCIRSYRQRRADSSNHTPDGVVKRNCALPYAMRVLRSKVLPIASYREGRLRPVG